MERKAVKPHRQRDTIPTVVAPTRAHRPVLSRSVKETRHLIIVEWAVGFAILELDNRIYPYFSGLLNHRRGYFVISPLNRLSGGRDCLQLFLNLWRIAVRGYISKPSDILRPKIELVSKEPLPHIQGGGLDHA